MIYFLIQYIGRPLTLITKNFKTFNAEVIPKKTGALVVCNHRHNFDPFVATCSTFKIRFHYVAKKELFKNPIISFILNSAGVIPVDREGIDKNMIRKSVELLKKGKTILIFGEGTRNKSKNIDLLPLKNGFSFIAAKAKVPVIPMYMFGVNNMFKLSLPRKKIRVYFGTPISSEQPLKNIVAQTTNELIELCKKGKGEYYGYK
jgi:1-acyl-sn-glycerol-3-phosphate acyltransferase